MGALGNIVNEEVKKEAEDIAFGLKRISDACDEFSKGIVGKTKDEVLKLVDKLELPNNLNKMKDFSGNSFKMETKERGEIPLSPIGAAAQNFSSDMKIIQFDATIIDLMESIDDFSERKDKNGQKISV